MNRDEIKKIVIPIMFEVKPDNESIIESDNLQDLGFDSLDTIEFIMSIEKEFNIGITEEDFQGVETVEQVIDLVENKLQS